MEPFVSIVMPCRNERESIATCLDSVLAGDYPKDRYEILVVDGMSDDGTREVLREYAAGDARIRIVDNPRHSTPAAMNEGIRRSLGGIIVRMDVHCVYPRRYVSGLVAWLQSSGADNVGADCVTRPANSSPKARAIAAAMSHPLGVGNSHFRLGVSEPRWVDTVPFGCFRRELFDRIGLYDEALVRNQDEELNHRLIRRGGRILLVPGLSVDYRARSSVGSLSRMYYGYGRLKPLVGRRVGRMLTWRPFPPVALVAALAVLAVLSWTSPAARVALEALVAVYAAAAGVGAIAIARTEGLPVGLWAAIVLPVMHLSYGVGFLFGLPALFAPRVSPVEAGDPAPAPW